MPRHTKGIHQTRDTESRVLDPEVAMVLRILDGNDTPDGFLDRYFALRATYDRDVWRQVITVLAQGRV